MAESAPPLRGGRARERRRERETEQQCSDKSVCTSEAATLLLSNLSLLSLLLVEPRIISRTGSCWDREQRCTLYIQCTVMAGVRQGVVIDESSGVQQVKNQNAQNALFTSDLHYLLFSVRYLAYFF